MEGAGQPSGAWGLAVNSDCAEGKVQAPETQPRPSGVKMLEGTPHLQGQSSGAAVGISTSLCKLALCLILP